MERHVVKRMASEFLLSFHMKENASGNPVCFKQDGQRFDQAHTVKLNVCTDYILTFKCRPAVTIEKLMINGELQKLRQEVASNDRGEDKNTYTAEIDTNRYTLSKSGKRQEMLIVLEFEDSVYMKLALQCKFYKKDETGHCQWGQKLNSVDCECRKEDGNNYVTVLKEKYI